eukprot:403351914
MESNINQMQQNVQQVEDNRLVQLQTIEGTITEVPVSIIQHSILIKGMIDDADVEEEIPLPDIQKKTLDQIIEFLTHLKDNAAPDIEKPLRSNNFEDATTPWYANFMNKDDDTIQDLILAANYMDIKQLLDLGCAKMGCIIRSLDIKQFRQRFNIVNDFTPEEEAEPFDEDKIAELAEQYQNELRQKQEQQNGNNDGQLVQ